MVSQNLPQQSLRYGRRAVRWKGLRPRLRMGKRLFGAEGVPTRLILVGAKGRVTNRSWGT
jgi:hypothetical protein